MAESTNSKQFFSYLIILAISTIFVLEWGPGSRGCNTDPAKPTTTAAAVVNGKEIPLQQFRDIYGRQLYMLRAQGSPINEQLAQQLGFPKRVLDMLVDRELLSQAAEREGVVPSDADVLAALQKNPDFQKDGHFDVEQYHQVVQDYLHKTPVEYEAGLRRELAADMMADLVQGSAAVSDEEVKARFMREGNKAQASYVRFLPSMFAAEVKPPSAAELAAFIHDHGTEISAFYDANKYLYHQPERLHARQILIKVAPDATAEQKAAARQKIDNLKKELDSGKDFAELAKGFSEDVGSKERGGDMGFNERSAFPTEVATEAFNLKAGQVSAPIESHYGFHLIKAEEVRPAENKELKDVEKQIAEQLYAKDKSKQLARAAAEKALAAVKGGKKLAELYPFDKNETPNSFEVESAPKTTDTGEFGLTAESIPKLGAAPELSKDIFARTGPGPLEKVYPVGDGFVVATVNERIRPNDTDFTAKKEALRDDALRAKQIELRESFLRSLKKSSQVVTNDSLLGPQNAS